MLTTREDVSGLIKDLAQRLSYPRLAEEVGLSETELKELATGKRKPSPGEITEIIWKLISSSSQHGFFDVLPAHGIPSVSYDIEARFKLDDPPVGYEEEPPVLPLREDPTEIAGYRVDFPLGLPASVLAANAKWIEFYARRGFDILTYKTVRTRYRQEHPWPNWVFLENPYEIEASEIKDPSKPPIMVGYPGFWPKDRKTISMANSFGVPSLAPEWWQEDLRRAREVVREGHQVLIVSVVASVEGKEAIRDDFVNAALMAQKEGADIIEANYSCPNTQGEKSGDLYHFPDDAREVSQALRDALGAKTPLFVKIGYLPNHELSEFVRLNAAFIRGIVAINTISAKIVDKEGKDAFPKRSTAGVSGWAIKARAQEVARNLVALRRELDVNFAILGLGGVLTPEDFSERLDIGVNAVESCTGAFLDPYLGLKVRADTEAVNKRPNRIIFELNLLKTLLGDALLHPFRSSRLIVDSNTRRVKVER